MGSSGILVAMIVISFFGFILYIGTICFNFFFARTGNNNMYREFYECGFAANNNIVVNFELHFIPISLIFLIYEMEIIIFVPLFLNTYGLSVTYLFLTLLSFFILSLSYIYEWDRYALTFTF